MTSSSNGVFRRSGTGLEPNPSVVSWAGESASLNWFDTAREYTERWHHQQQIRAATNRPGILDRTTYYPVLDTFMRSVPHNYRSVAAPDGTSIAFRISGEAGGAWVMQRISDLWRLTPETPASPAAEVTIPDSIAWRIFTKGISRDQARSQVTIAGDETLGAHILGAIAIVG